jgi:hypothetical protein
MGRRGPGAASIIRTRTPTANRPSADYLRRLLGREDVLHFDITVEDRNGE